MPLPVELWLIPVTRDLPVESAGETGTGLRAGHVSKRQQTCKSND